MIATQQALLFTAVKTAPDAPQPSPEPALAIAYWHDGVPVYIAPTPIYNKDTKKIHGTIPVRWTWRLGWQKAGD